MHSYQSAYIKGLQPDPDINLVQWSDMFRELPSESSIEPGKYRTDRVPYMREILEVLSPNHPCNPIYGFRWKYKIQTLVMFNPI